MEVRFLFPIAPVLLLDAVTNHAPRREVSRNRVVSDGAEIQSFKRPTGDPAAFAVLEIEDPAALETVAEAMEGEPWDMSGRWCWRDEAGEWHTVG